MVLIREGIRNIGRINNERLFYAHQTSDHQKHALRMQTIDVLEMFVRLSANFSHFSNFVRKCADKTVCFPSMYTRCALGMDTNNVRKRVAAWCIPCLVGSLLFMSTITEACMFTLVWMGCHKNGSLSPRSIFWICKKSYVIFASKADVFPSLRPSVFTATGSKFSKDCLRNFLTQANGARN